MTNLTSRLKGMAKGFVKLGILIMPLIATELHGQKPVHIKSDEIRIVWGSYGRLREGIDPVYNDEGKLIREKVDALQDSTFRGIKKYSYEDGLLKKEEYRFGGDLYRLREYFYNKEGVLARIEYDHNGDGVVDATGCFKGSERK